MDYSSSNRDSRQTPNTKAPSEKHLEDWIVANFNRFGYEDFINDKDDPDEYYFAAFCSRLISRQIRLPNGRPDLIGITSGHDIILPVSVCVIELKRGAIDYTTMGQCLRYMGDLRQVHYSNFFGVESPRDRILLPPTRRDYINDFPWCDYEPVTGIIVGHSFEDANIPFICAQCNVSVVTYDYNSGTNEYIFTYHNAQSKGKLSDYDELAYGALGQAFNESVSIYHADRTRKGTSI